VASRVYLAARDLVFRSKLGAAVAARGGEVVLDDAGCEFAVLDAEAPDALTRIRGFVTRGIPVLVYGPHVRAELLRAAREAGAVAVPNSQVEATLRDLLA